MATQARADEHPETYGNRPRAPSGRLRTIATAMALCSAALPAGSQAPQSPSAPPGRLVDLGGYRLHLLCTGTRHPGAPTVVLSIGGGGFALDWSLVQKPLSDSARVCSYDRPGFGWSDAGPTPRTLAQEAFEVRSALETAGERAPFILVGQSLGAFVVRRFAEAHPADVSGVVLVEPANENGYLGYAGQWVIPRTLASARPVPPVRSFAESPPVPSTGADRSSCLTGGDRSVRLFRCFVPRGPRDDYFAEEMAAFYGAWAATPHPLGAVPLVVITGTKRRTPPPGLSEAQLRSDSLRLDLSRLSSRGRSVSDSLSGHHVQQDNPALIVEVVRRMMRPARE
jgi:pimeloyl-ACP methyl ester carboxylesterase